MGKKRSYITDDVSLAKILQLHAALIDRSDRDSISWHRDIEERAALARKVSFTWSAPSGVVKVQRLGDQAFSTVIYDKNGTRLRDGEYEPTRALHAAATRRYDRQAQVVIDAILAEIGGDG